MGWLCTTSDTTRSRSSRIRRSLAAFRTSSNVLGVLGRELVDGGGNDDEGELVEDDACDDCC
jgi:hypothetical protein